MKKIVLSLAIIMGVFGFSKAQESTKVITTENNPVSYHDQEIVKGAIPFTHSQFNRREAGGWYTFYDVIAEELGLTYTNTAIMLFPDSLMYIVNNNGTNEIRRPFYSTFGSFFDPKDVLFIDDNGGLRNTSRWTNYTYDSVAWMQAYIREVDSLEIVNSVFAKGTVTVLDYTQLSGATFSIGDGVLFETLLEGTDWNASDDNASTAASLANAITNLGRYTVSVEDNIITIQASVIGSKGNEIGITSDNPSLVTSGTNLSGGADNITKVEIVDTLFVQHFKGSNNNLQISGVRIDGDAQQYYYGKPNSDKYDKNTLLNSGAFKTDTILLTANDSTLMDDEGRFFFKGVQIPVGEEINGEKSNDLVNSIVSTCLIFKPMKPYTFADTLTSFSDGVKVKSKNNFYYVGNKYANGEMLRISNPEGINNQYGTGSDIRYGQTVRGFKSYYSVLNLFSWFFFHITPYNLDVVVPNADGYGLGDAYPNPTDNALNFTIPFSLGTAQSVTFEIKDMTGRVIKTVTSDYVAGDNLVEIETVGLNAGIYFYSMNTENFNATGKVIVK